MVLKEQDIKEQIKEYKNWRYKSGKLYADFSFKNFVQSLDFVNKVGSLAENLQHHPNITIEYNKVSLVLWTHDKGAVTEKDLEFIKNLEAKS